MDLRLDRFHTAVIWDFMLNLRPNKTIGVYFANRQKHSLLKTEGVVTQYLGFHQAGVGVKIYPMPNMEITVGANIPYGWRIWKDYKYVGAHVDMTFYLAKGPR